MKKTLTKRRQMLRKLGRSSTSQAKRRIQGLLRDCVIIRDDGCVLRYHPEANRCSGVLQAEHLNSRSHSRTFGDLRNIVCLCSYHHIWFKKQHSRLYWELIERVIGPERWKWLKLAEADRTPYKADWTLIEIVLAKELEKLQEKYGVQRERL